MSESTVVVFGDQPPVHLDRVAGRAKVLVCDENSLPQALPTADVLLVWDFTSDAVRDAWPGEGPRPAWVHTASAGVDRLLCPELVASDTVLTNARGVFEQPIAEYVAGLVVAMAKDFHGSWELQRQRRWQHRETMRLAGTRAVVVGAGPIGRAIGSTLAALGVVVDLVGRTARQGVRGGDELPELLPSADWVVSAAPLTDANRGMFDRTVFDRMKPSARFINVGRGPLVVEKDLTAALVARRIAGAALDVFEHEPLASDDPLWDVPGLFVSPHMSGDTVGWRDHLADQFQDNYERWCAGEPLLNIVDKRLGYVPVD
ncbi:D-2-hydroxyacid dehydrogenase [Streptomyces iranensis]|uniref:NAD-binding D-isomer specific 2-hydroxyaciddehydrogenase n=1 Tax=Streptomyces iranensis TaxID=576784 RepID=A0A060ZTN9_9ACTN|nr:D-2-hydroxyacid dehydrogenase [Streptomyces iranensis]MBP2061597.1 phosphoglycerate dehydrogenase-like enzyme [Streptomyces iranensis]CDR09577.1 NAD-binding D-isomer specific 2-hydroxyaciddehydrogenase [Streptomyces iranensis]